METEQFGVRSGGWSDLPITDAAWDEGRARAALDSWAGDSMSKYARGFLWAGPDTENKSNYKFPIAAPVDGKLTIYIRAVNNAKARLGSANIPAADKSRLESALNGIQRRHGGSDRQEMALLASAAPVHPPKAWFTKPPIGPKNKIMVTDSGRVFGWAAPNGCHRGAMAATGACITPSTMARSFAHFEVGTTKTAEGELLDTGSLVWDTTHAPMALSASAAKRHYEDTGMAFADVKVGFDDSQPGGAIWFSGAMRPTTSQADWQKARQSPLSVDARRVGRDLALIDLLAVNRPGFAVLTAGLEEGSEDLGVEIYSEQGVQMTLIASWDPEGDDETFDLTRTVAPDQVGQVDTDSGCGCPDVKAALSTLSPLLTPQESADRRTKLSAYERI